MGKKKVYTPLPGYPKEFVFQTINDVENYFSGNLIECLKCGHHFKGLARHIKKQHDISADEYKEEYGIPWGRGLTSGLLHTELSLLAKENETVSNIGENVDNPPKGRKINVRKYCQARINAKRKYHAEDFYKFADLVAGGSPILTTSQKDGMPSVDTVREFLKKDKDFRSYWRRNVTPKILRLRDEDRKSLFNGKVLLALKMAKDGSTPKQISEATGYSENDARLFISGKAWKSINHKDYLLFGQSEEER